MCQRNHFCLCCTQRHGRLLKKYRCRTTIEFYAQWLYHSQSLSAYLAHLLFFSCFSIWLASSPLVQLGLSSTLVLRPATSDSNAVSCKHPKNKEKKKHFPSDRLSTLFTKVCISNQLQSSIALVKYPRFLGLLVFAKYSNAPMAHRCPDGSFTGSRYLALGVFPQYISSDVFQFLFFFSSSQTWNSACP